MGEHLASHRLFPAPHNPWLYRYRFDISYTPEDGDWTVAAYGRNITDERYDNARLNVDDYVLFILSNDASEFGVRFTKDF